MLLVCTELNKFVRQFRKYIHVVAKSACYYYLAQWTIETCEKSRTKPFDAAGSVRL